jgi:Leucine-rich repeat (LRR) protein
MDDFSPTNDLNGKSALSDPSNVSKTGNTSNQDLARISSASIDRVKEPEKKGPVIHFPHDRSLGDLYLADPKGKAKFLGQALGEVHVPDKAQVFLYYDYDQVYGCSRLARIASDALYGLSFLGTEITDSDLQFLKHFEALEELDVSCTSLGDGCLPHLQDLPNLLKLNLSSTKITSKSADTLCRFKSVVELILDDTVLGDQALMKLSSLTRLETLSLSFTEVTSRGLSKIKTLKNLKRLRLNSTNVSNAGIDFLMRLTKLEELWLKSTRVTFSGLAELKKQLPNCQIVY